MEITVEKIRETAVKYEKLAEISRRYKSAKSVYERRSRGSYKFEKVLTFLLLGTILAILAVVAVYFGSLVRYAIIYESLGDPQMFEVLYDRWVESLPKLCKTTFMVTFVAILPLAFFGGVISAKKDLRIATEKNTELTDALNQFVKQNELILTILPKSYRYPLAANFIAEVLESGSADTMKEARNLYEEQLHRWKMENKMNKLIEEQKRVFTTVWYI